MLEGSGQRRIRKGTLVTIPSVLLAPHLHLFVPALHILVGEEELQWELSVL